MNKRGESPPCLVVYMKTAYVCERREKFKKQDAKFFSFCTKRRNFRTKKYLICTKKSDFRTKFFRFRTKESEFGTKKHLICTKEDDFRTNEGRS